VFSIRSHKFGVGDVATCLNPLLSEAVFSMEAQKRASPLFFALS